VKVPRHILAEAIASKTLHVSDKSLLAREIAAYLLAERRTAELESILRDIMQYRTEHGVLEAEVVTAHDVTAQVTSDVKQLLRAAYPNAKTIHLSNRQDTGVVGGLRIDMANEQLDMTVSDRLATFKRLTSEGTT
jgi:F0F1-type ATP synthase delta subunit